jgi:lipopolysaccharide export system permease protein
VKTIDRYLLKQFFPIFLASLAMFILLVILIDLFVHLVRFLNSGASVKEILTVSLYYIPKSFLYALPVSLLFASAYTLGDLYVRNELTTLLCSGIPFWRFCVPLFAIGLIASLFSFFFEDSTVIPTLRVKNALTKRILQTQSDNNSADVVIKTRGGRLIYAVDYFDALNNTLNGLTVLELGEDGSVLSVIRTPKADWTGEYWSLTNPVKYAYEGEFIKPVNAGDSRDFTETPEEFTRSSIAADELRAKDAYLHIKDLRNAGLPIIEAKTDYYHRFSFSAVSFVVIFLSVTLGGRFTKNILLMTLLTSLGAASVFYVIEMITIMSAKVGLMPPFLGAFFPVLVCIAAGFAMLRKAKT